MSWRMVVDCLRDLKRMLLQYRQQRRFIFFGCQFGPINILEEWMTFDFLEPFIPKSLLGFEPEKLIDDVLEL